MPRVVDMVYDDRVSRSGFTIAELLIVIVVIGILATITIVAYSGVQQKAVVASLISDLANASDLLNLDQTNNNKFPDSLALANGGQNIPASPGTSYSYAVSNNTKPQIFCLSGLNGSQTYSVTQDGPPAVGICPMVNLDGAIASSYPKTGSVWTDLSGHGNVGTLVGGISYSPTSGGALSFDGLASYVNVPTSPSLDFGTGDFSVSFWCYRTAAGYQGGSYLVKGGLGTPGIETYDGNFRVDTSAGNLANIALNASFNVWENHVFVVNQTTAPFIKHYINGGLDQTGYSGPGATGSVNSAANLIIGRSNAGGIFRYYNGSIGSFRLYGKALSQDDVNQNFTALRGRYGI